MQPIKLGEITLTAAPTAKGVQLQVIRNNVIIGSTLENAEELTWLIAEVCGQALALKLLSEKAARRQK